MPISDNAEQGVFLPTTYTWDVSELYSIEVTSPEFKELLVRLYQNINRIILAVNAKESGYYPLFEFVTSQQYFPDPALNSLTPQTPAYRQTFRYTLNVGALGAGNTTIAHGLDITSTWSFTHIYGAASTFAGTGDYYPIPFASGSGANNIELRATNTDVIIENNSGVTFTSCYIVVEYLKQ